MIKKSLVLILGCSLTAVAQPKQIKERIEELKESAEELDLIDRMYDVQLVIKPEEVPFDEEDAFAFTHSVKLKSGKEVLEALKTKKVYQDIIAPYSLLQIGDTDLFDWNSMLGVGNFFFDEHPDYMPKLILKKVYFADGSVQTAKEVLVENYEKILGEDKSRLNDEFFLIKSTKSVESLEYEVALKNTAVQTAVFKKDQTEQLMNGMSISVKSWTGKEVGFLFPEHLYKEMAGMDVLYKDGRFLDQKGSNTSNLPPESKRKQLQEISAFYKETARMAEKNKFTGLKDLEDYLLKNVPKIDTVTPNDVLKNYYFSGPPSEIRMYFPVKTPAEVLETIKNNRIYSRGIVFKREIATDFKSQKQGVMDVGGNWIIKPVYERIYNQNDYFFLVQEKEDGPSSYYWLNEKGDQWVHLKNIEIYRNELYGDFLVVEEGTNGPKGIFNIKSGQMVVPPVNDNIYVEDNFFVIRNNDNITLLDAHAQNILSGDFESVRIDEPFIYVLPKGANAFSGYHIYNKKGKNITGQFISDGGWESGSNLVLVYKKGKGEYERHYFFLDSDGKVVITVDPDKYVQTERFRNNRALLKDKNGMYGYMNEKGTVVIPFVFTDASEFRGKYALVKHKLPTGSTWIGLVDETGKQKKKFEEWPYYISFSDEENTWIYQMNSGIRYDEEGNEMHRVQ